VLERLAPTHIVTQIQCDVCAVSLRDVERSIASRLPTRPKIVSLEPNTLEDVWSDFYRVAEALAVNPEVVERLQTRMCGISAEARSSGERPRVVCVEWLEPLMAAGNWTPQLIEMAGGINVFGEPGRHSPPLCWEEIVTQDPDVILAAPCGFDMERTENEMHWLTERPEWNGLSAVRSQRVYVADGNQYFNRPGPRLVESLRILAEVLHPRLNPTLEGTGWKRFPGSN
jgi:iron complex transport system substrate-binding protein